MRRNSRNLMIMLGVLVALGAGVIAEQVREKRFGPRVFLDVPERSLARIERRCTGCVPLTLLKRQGRWELTQPFVAPASSEQVERLVRISRSQVRHFYDEGSLDLAKAGLNEPFATLVLDERTLEFGAASAGQDRYVRSGKRLALVQDRFATLLTAPPEQFVDPRPLAGRRAVAGRRMGAEMTAAQLTHFGNLSAVRMEPSPAVIGAHRIQITLDNGREETFNFDLHEGGVILLRRGQPYVYVLDRAGALGLGLGLGD